jgi:phospholipase/lecithinase/hemolysin
MNRTSQDPGQRKGREGADQFTAAFNAELDGQLNALEETFDITIFRFDLLGLHDAMINSPAEFGLTNVTDPASPGLTPVPELGAEHPIVPNPDEYMYWDTFHWTRVVHEIVGDAAADQLERTLSLR